MNRLQNKICKKEGENILKKGRITAVFMSGLLLMNGCSLIENDLNKFGRDME